MPDASFEASLSNPVFPSPLIKDELQYFRKDYDTVEHTYDACPKYNELGSFRIIAYLYVSDGGAKLKLKTSRKKYSVFIYSEAEPHAVYAI